MSFLVEIKITTLCVGGIEMFVKVGTYSRYRRKSYSEAMYKKYKEFCCSICKVSKLKEIESTYSIKNVEWKIPQKSSLIKRPYKSSQTKS